MYHKSFITQSMFSMQLVFEIFSHEISIFKKINCSPIWKMIESYFLPDWCGTWAIQFQILKRNGKEKKNMHDMMNGPQKINIFEGGFWKKVGIKSRNGIGEVLAKFSIPPPPQDLKWSFLTFWINIMEPRCSLQVLNYQIHEYLLYGKSIGRQTNFSQFGKLLCGYVNLQFVHYFCGIVFGKYLRNEMS